MNMNDRDYQAKRPAKKDPGYVPLKGVQLMWMDEALTEYRDGLLRLEGIERKLVHAMERVYHLDAADARHILADGDFGRYWLQSLKEDPNEAFIDLNHRYGGYHQLICDDMWANGMDIPGMYERASPPIDKDNTEQKPELVAHILHGNAPGLAASLIATGIFSSVTEPDGTELRDVPADMTERDLMEPSYKVEGEVTAVFDDPELYEQFKDMSDRQMAFYRMLAQAADNHNTGHGVFAAEDKRPTGREQSKPEIQELPREVHDERRYQVFEDPANKGIADTDGNKLSFADMIKQMAEHQTPDPAFMELPEDASDPMRAMQKVFQLPNVIGAELITGHRQVGCGLIAKAHDDIKLTISLNEHADAASIAEKIAEVLAEAASSGRLIP